MTLGLFSWTALALSFHCWSGYVTFPCYVIGNRSQVLMSLFNLGKVSYGLFMRNVNLCSFPFNVGRGMSLSKVN